MRSTGPSTRSARQGGQAIVLIALMLAVLFGMLGLAIDSGRAYVDRRQMQDAVDAATLAAGDSFENYGSESSAYDNAYTVFQRVLGLSGGSSTKNLSTHTMTANWSGTTYGYTITMSNNAFNGTIFQASATHTFPLTFFQVLGASPTIPISTLAGSIVGNQTSQPALLTLSTSGCSLSLSGTTSVTVRGDVYSDGCISFQGSATLGVAGSAYSHVGNPPSSITLLCYNPNPTIPPHSPPCSAGETLGALNGSAPVIPDPKYPAGNAAWYSTVAPATVSHTGWTEMQPGRYSNWALTGGVGCYFMDAGMYEWGGGYTSHGGFTSNELKPPDEPAWNYGTNSLDYTQLASPQFYNTFKSCAGSVSLATSGSGLAITPANQSWLVEVTAVRSDTYPPSGQPGSTTYARESAPSACHYINPAANKSFTVDVGTGQQVPGATSYNVYVAPSAASSCTNVAQTSYGYVGTFTESQHQLLVDGSVVSGTSWMLGTRGSSQCGNPLSLTHGCAPPDGESKPVCFIGCTGTSNNGLANENPPKATLPQGDEANENYCSPQTSSAAVPCLAARVTPGAVQFYFPNNGDCLNEDGNGATYVFSGYQYQWISIYQNAVTPPPGSCGNVLNGGSATEYIGTVYTPTSSWSINGGNRAPLSGQVIAFTASLNGNATIGINFDPNYAPAPPAARLVV